MLIPSLIFLICIVLFIWDKFKSATVALLGCVAMAVSGVITPAEAFAGFTNDLAFIVFGTEIFGISFVESGLAHIVAKRIFKSTKGNEKKIILIAGIVGAVLSAFLNNLMICYLMMVICISIANSSDKINVKNITLPVIIAAIIGGQLTLIGAPATLVASSLSDKTAGISISMFELSGMGIIILAAGLAFMYFFSYRTGIKIWGEEKEAKIENAELYAYKSPNKRKITVVLIAAAVMLTLFIGGWVSVGVASLIGGLICLFGGAVKQREAFAKVDWNTLIWIACCIGLTDGFVKGGAVSAFVGWFVGMGSQISPYVIFLIFIVLSFVISNLIANTTTVLMLLPFALEISQSLGYNPKTFLIGITMAAGLAIMTPLSSGFIAMTQRIGYRFKDYVRYSWGLQIVLAILTVVLTLIFYPI